MSSKLIRRLLSALALALAAKAMFCLASPGVMAADDTPNNGALTLKPENLALGPLLQSREKLLKTILEEGELGVGVKPYLNAFSSIEKSVRDGKDETAIKSEIDRLSNAVAEQQKHSLGEAYTNVKDRIWGPYTLSIIRKVRYNWHPTKSDRSYAITLRYSIFKNGDIGKIVITKSCGDKLADQEAINAVKRASPVAPWPANAEDNTVDVEQEFTYNGGTGGARAFGELHKTLPSS